MDSARYVTKFKGAMERQLAEVQVRLLEEFEAYAHAMHADSKEYRNIELRVAPVEMPDSSTNLVSTRPNFARTKTPDPDSPLATPRVDLSNGQGVGDGQQSGNCVEERDSQQKFVFQTGSTSLTLHPTMEANELSKTIQQLRFDEDLALDIKSSGLSLLLKTRLRRLLNWSGFDYMIGIIIFLNSITIGIEITIDLDKDDPIAVLRPWVLFLENVFLITYVGELALRFYVKGFHRCLRSGWIIFDLLLVICGAISSWIIAPYIKMRTGKDGDESASVVDRVLVLRVLRLLRLVRALRLLKKFEILWRLVHGLLNSVTAMLSTLALLTVSLYVFACVAIEVITKSNKFRDGGGLQNLVQTNFQSIPTAMLTLIRFVTLDSPSALYAPLVTAEPALMIYFVVILLVISVALMNLVTAVLVEGAISSSLMDKEAARHERKRQMRMFAPLLQKMFRDLDADNSGCVTREEIFKCIKVFPPSLLEPLRNHSVGELFDILDADCTGNIDEDEFVDGMLQMIVSDADPDMMQMLALLKANRRKIAQMEFLISKIDNRTARKRARLGTERAALNISTQL